MDGHKLCSKCKAEKLQSEFGPDVRRSDGLQCWCRDCTNAYSREHKKHQRAREDFGEIVQERKCSDCEIVKPRDQFYVDRGCKGGLGYICKSCMQDRQRKIQGKRKAAYKGPRVDSRVCSICKLEKQASEFTTERGNSDGLSCQCRECQRSEHRKFRLEVFSHYSIGDPKCACCGEGCVEFLSIDHVDGGGNEHRKQIGGYGAAMYRWLKKHGYPEGYQILCHNCNQAKGFYGICPHQRAREQAT